MASTAIKLYPPTIEGTIPAFYGTTLVVPFSMNRTVDENDVIGFRVKIKTVQSGRQILSKDTDQFTFDPAGIATFELTEEEAKVFNLGQHYKLQMAYIAKSNEIFSIEQLEHKLKNELKELEDRRNNGEFKTEDEYEEEKKSIEAKYRNLLTGLVGYYSTVGVTKYTTKPNVRIEGLELKKVNMHNYQYYGVYSQENGDTSEKVYSYCFNLYDDKDNILQTSGELIHNGADNLLNFESVNKYDIPYDFILRKPYYLEYVVTTTNKMTVSSGKYKIMQKKFIDPEIKADLSIKTNFENGYVALSLIGQKDEDGIEYAATGTYKILRASSEDDFNTWNPVLNFALYGQQVSRWSWKDFTIKQGVSYKYALQQYNAAGITSNRIESNEIYADYEHAFISDGKRQLKIKYNPKMTSFKNTLLESKVNTIGSQFPFTFRNAHVKYKEFPIAGLISCQLDDEYLFTNEENYEDFDYTINLVSGNIATEREFKLDVLEWLNDGNPKLFRSPTEGNYIIRLINVSMAPEDALGRMLHNFQATAYEIDAYTYENLVKHGLLSIGDPTKPQLRWETIELDKTGIGDENDNILNYRAVALRFEGMIPGDRLYIDDKIVREPRTLDENGRPITGFGVIIGSTGSYSVDLDAGVEVYSVRFEGSEDNNYQPTTEEEDYEHLGIVQHQGTLTYAYYSKTQNRFDTISNIQLHDIAMQQFIGEHDIIKEIENLRYMIHDIYWLRATLRDIVEVYRDKKGSYYYDKDCTELIDWDEYPLYKVTESTGLQYYYDRRSNTKINIDEYDPHIYFGNDEVNAMDLSVTKGFNIKDSNGLTTIRIGNGVNLELSYQLLEFEYKVEKSDRYPEVAALRIAKDKAYEELLFAVCPYEEDDEGNITWAADYSESMYETMVKKAQLNYNKISNDFIIELEKALKKEEAIQGDVAV